LTVHVAIFVQSIRCNNFVPFLLNFRVEKHFSSCFDGDALEDNLGFD
jgi:hypothetical protein